MIIRAASQADAAQISQLTSELGYQADEAALRARIGRLATYPDHRVFVAEVGSAEIAGWLHAHASEALESGFRVEILGLVVGNRFRRRGVGRELVRAAEAWANELACDTLVVRTNVTRAESHEFYAALGFSWTKTQAVYRKPVT